MQDTSTYEFETEVNATVEIDISVEDQNGNELTISDLQRGSNSSHVEVIVDVPQMEDMSFSISDEDGNMYDIKSIEAPGSSEANIMIHVPDKAYKYETAVKLLDKDGNTLMEGGEAEISIGNPHTDQNPMEITLSETAYKKIYDHMRKKIGQEILQKLFNEKEEK